MPRLFAPWMPWHTRPGAGCFTVCELTFFGMSSGAGQGRRSMCRPWTGGLAPQVRGGGFPRGNPCPRANLCGLAAGPAVPCCGAVPPLRRVGTCPPFLSQAPGPTRRAAQPREKKRLGRQGGPKHNNARTGTKAHGSTAKGRANHPKPPTLAAPREGRQAQNRGAVERRTRGRAYPGGRVLGRLPRPPRDGHCRGAQGGRQAPPQAAPGPCAPC